MKWPLAIIPILAAAIYLFGVFWVWATIVTVLALVGCVGAILILDAGR